MIKETDGRFRPPNKNEFEDEDDKPPSIALSDQTNPLPSDAGICSLTPRDSSLDICSNGLARTFLRPVKDYPSNFLMQFLQQVNLRNSSFDTDMKYCIVDVTAVNEPN